jgi:hypothetical protein
MRNQIAGRTWLGIVAAGLAAIVSVSCGGAIAQRSQSAGNNPAARLALNPSNVDFGAVSLGDSKTSAITLSNSSLSGAKVTFTQVQVAGKGFSATTAALPLTLAPGQASMITITFAPQAAGSATGSLSIVVVGASTPATIPLAGTGLGATQLAVTPSALNFGGVAVGSRATKAGALTAGSSTITVSSAAWNGQGFAVSGISFPLTVAAGTSVTYTVSFTPQAAGSSPGNISFVSNASNSPATQTLAGTGTQSGSSAGPHSADLMWNASLSAVAGYYVYRGSQSGGPYSRLNATPLLATDYSDSTVQPGSTYYYVTTAVDANSVESVYSNQATAAVPTP